MTMNLKTWWKGCLAAAALAVFGGVAAYADPPHPRPGVSLGGRAAYYNSRAPGADDTWFGGAQLRWHWTDMWAAEGSIDYQRTRLSAQSVAHVYPVQASLLAYLIPKSPVNPFIMGGFGWYYTSVDSTAGDRTDNRFGPHAGAGMEFFLNDHWSIDGTWRYTWLNNIRASENLGRVDYDGSGWMATAGLNYRF